MKKSLILMAAAALLLAGCAKEMDSPVKETPIGMKTVTLKASYDADLTKTTYEGDKTLSWTAGDKIGVGVTVDGQIQTVAFELTDGAGTPSGTFTGEIPENGELTNTAFYPWNGEQSDDPATGGSNVGGDGYVYFHQFPETAWVEGEAPLLLAAQFDDPNAIVFKQAAGAMKVTLKEVPADADKLVLTVNNKEISGWFALNPANVGTDAITTANEGTGGSTLAYSFATAEADRDMTFYFPLPAIELPSFNIELFAGNASLWSMASTKSRTVGRGKILRMPELTVEVASRTYYLVGYIDGADYYGNDYKFDKEGNLETTLPEGNNYVFIKRGNGGDGNNYYFAQYCEDPTGTVYRYNDGQGEKMLVPGGKKLAFTLVPDEENPDKMTLSYETRPALKKVWGHYGQAGVAGWPGLMEGITDLDGNIRNATFDDDFVYIPKTKGVDADGDGNFDEVKIFKFNVSDGSYAGLVQRTTDPDYMAGTWASTFPVSCARVMKNTDPALNDGKDILVCTNLSDGQNVRLYAWENGVNQQPRLLTNISGLPRRFGDRISVEGTYQKGRVWYRSFAGGMTAYINLVPGYTAGFNGSHAWNWVEGLGATATDDGDNMITEYTSFNNGAFGIVSSNSGKGIYLVNGTATVNTYPGYKRCFGWHGFELDGTSYIAYLDMSTGTDKPAIAILEGKYDTVDNLQATLDAKNVVLKAAFATEDVEDFTTGTAYATNNVGECEVRIIDGVPYILGATRGSIALFKMLP